MLADGFANTINKLKANDTAGTGSSYQTTINFLKGFKRNLQISDVNKALR